MAKPSDRHSSPAPTQKKAASAPQAMTAPTPIQPRKSKANAGNTAQKPTKRLQRQPQSKVISFPVASVCPPTPPKPPTLFNLTLRLMIVATATAAMVGTGLSIFKPELKTQQQPDAAALAQLDVPEFTPLPESQPMTTVEKTIEGWLAGRKQLYGGLFFLNLSNGRSANIRGEEVFPAASTIKIPILVALFQALDRGEVSLDEPLTMRPDLIVGEAGTMQYQKPGTKFSTLETAEMMISISDNTATNMLIDRLGGAAVLNEQFIQWGLEHTAIHNPLPDMKGTNTTSPKDLAILMARIERGDLVSDPSREKLLGIMRTTVTNTLLPQGLGPGAKIAHKTGDIGTVVGDAGLIEMPNGQKYVAGIMVKRPYNDPQGTEIIRQISRLTYQAYTKP